MAHNQRGLTATDTGLKTVSTSQLPIGLRATWRRSGDQVVLDALSVVDAAAVAHVEGDDDEFPTADVEDHAVVAHSQSP